MRDGVIMSTCGSLIDAVVVELKKRKAVEEEKGVVIITDKA